MIVIKNSPHASHKREESNPRAGATPDDKRVVCCFCVAALRVGSGYPAQLHLAITNSTNC